MLATKDNTKSDVIQNKHSLMSSTMLLRNSVPISDDADLAQHVHVGDVLAACRGVRADVQAVLSVQVERTSVQGFTSLILRVIATVRLHDCSTTEIKLVFKRLPVLENQLKAMKKLGLFEREVTFYRFSIGPKSKDIASEGNWSIQCRDIVPLLMQRCRQLPLAKCYLAQGTNTVLEDLNETGYVMLTKDMKDMGREGVVGLAEARLVVRRLAQFHATSMFNVLPPQIRNDAMFMGPIDKSFCFMLHRSCRTTEIAMHELLPHYTRHTDWLLGGTNCFDALDRLARPSSDGLNVLCHGDCHVNNMMFKHDKDGNPVDVKFLDMQLVRYGPPSRDLSYFMYMSTSRKFRQQYEREILQTYVEAFNAAACTTPDLLTLDSFMAEYEECRMFGYAMAMNLKPKLTMTDVMPVNGEALSHDSFETIILKDSSGATREQLRTNPEFKQCMTDLVEELVPILDRFL